MAIEVIDTVQLLEVQSRQKVPYLFWLNMGFKRQINFTEGKIAFDRVNEDYRRLAPFVAPNVQGKVMAREGSDMLAFAPAYVKPKHVIDINVPFERQPGEALMTGSMSPQQRRDAVIANLLKRHRHMHEMTREWLAARALIDGTVTISGENYPATTVDFRRDATLSETLLTTARWNQAGTSFPLTNIRTMRGRVNSLSGGSVSDLIFGAGAWDSFSQHATITPLLDTQYRGSQTDITKVMNGFDDSTEYLGSLAGSAGSGTLRLWLYTGKYKDETDTLQDILNTDTVVGVDWNTFSGVRCYGAIKDGAADFQPLEYFPKHWEDQDPWNEYIMTQSAPLMVPTQPNASFKIKVQ
jgi:hypothetical protein